MTCLGRVGTRGILLLLLVEMKTHTATLEINKIVFQKTEDQPITRSSYTTHGHISKGCQITPQIHLLSCIHSALSYPEPGQSRCLSMKEWIKKKYVAPHWLRCGSDILEVMSMEELSLLPITHVAAWMEGR